MSKTFLHSGSAGDIVMSLPTIKAMGGGVLLLDIAGGSGNEYVQGHQRVG